MKAITYKLVSNIKGLLLLIILLVVQQKLVAQATSVQFEVDRYIVEVGQDGSSEMQIKLKLPRFTSNLFSDIDAKFKLQPSSDYEYSDFDEGDDIDPIGAESKMINKDSLAEEDRLRYILSYSVTPRKIGFDSIGPYSLRVGNAQYKTDVLKYAMVAPLKYADSMAITTLRVNDTVTALYAQILVNYVNPKPQKSSKRGAVEVSAIDYQESETYGMVSKFQDWVLEDSYVEVEELQQSPDGDDDRGAVLVRAYGRYYAPKGTAAIKPTLDIFENKSILPKKEFKALSY